MKKIGLLFIFICFVLSLKAQINNELKTVVSAKNMNIVYLDVDNPISIAVSGIDNRLITAVIKKGNATIKNIGLGEYIVNVKRVETPTVHIDIKDHYENIYGKDSIISISSDEIIEIAVFAYIDNKKVECGTQKFRVIPLSHPKFEVENNAIEEIEINNLLKNPYLKVMVEEFDFPIRYKIEGFQMRFNIKGVDQEDKLIANNNYFTLKMISKIKELEKGDKIYIEDIKISESNKEITKANKSLILLIK